MIYLLLTNRPDWAEFAYTQYLKCKPCRLVVIDNSESGIDFWKGKAHEYFHLPELENVGQMFNWYLDNGTDLNHDLFFMDDDIEISTETLPEMLKWLPLGWDCVKLCRVYVTDTKKKVSKIWLRSNSIGIGACWLMSKDLWRTQRFDDRPINAICHYFASMKSYNIRFIQKPLANYMIHGENVSLKTRQFRFDLSLVQL